MLNSYVGYFIYCPIVGGEEAQPVRGVHTAMPRTIDIPVSDADGLRHDLELQIHQ